jgi:hypothetical protein
MISQISFEIMSERNLNQEVTRYFDEWKNAPNDQLEDERKRLDGLFDAVKKQVSQIPDGDPNKGRIMEERELIWKKIGAIEETIGYRKRKGLIWWT